jgi:hypothetical protein
VADSIQLLILIIFATLFLLLTQSRELMRQIARTAEEWHRMRDAMRGPRRKHKPLTGSPDPLDADVLGPDRPDDTEPDSQ